MHTAAVPLYVTGQDATHERKRAYAPQRRDDLRLREAHLLDLGHELRRGA